MTRRLRSQAWFGASGKLGLLYRSWMRNQGPPDDMFDGRPVIGICNTYSELTPCNAHLNRLAERVKQGVRDSGGWPLEFPVMSLGEVLLRPTAMLYRNLASMDVEESIRANPIDGVVLLAGCDKTTPALLMGAASCNLPTLLVSGGAMLNGRFRDQTIGSGTHVWKLTEQHRAGELSTGDLDAAEIGMSRSDGHCMTMGTASTMASVAESLGIALPGNAAIPAVDANRGKLAHLSGRRIVEMVHEDLIMSRILVREAFENAIKVVGAVGGSTNAVIHLIAIARRMGVPLNLNDWDEIGREIPCVLNLMPTGSYLMEDFYYAGGLPALMKEIAELLDLQCLTVTGKTVGENLENAEIFNRDVIRSRNNPLLENAGLAVLRGNLAPDGAIIKPCAASEHLMSHRGPALVFDSIEEYRACCDDDDLDVTADSVLILKNAGPVGYPGMPEVGNLPIPKKILKQGVTDMLRISDARMSGTGYGSVVLHVAPEAAIGGPLSLVRDGDEIEIDVSARLLSVNISDEELDLRRQAWRPPETRSLARGYQKLYVDHVQQASEGADLDFLVGQSGSAVPRDNH